MKPSRVYAFSTEYEKDPDGVDAFVRRVVADYLSQDCQWPSRHQQGIQWMNILRELVPSEQVFKAQLSTSLGEGLEKALEGGFIHEDKIAHIQWLLENGASINGKYKVSCEYIRHFMAEYKKDPDPARVPGIFAAYREDFCKRHVEDYAKGLLRFFTCFATGEDPDPESIDAIKIPEDTAGLTHFELHLGDITARPGISVCYRFGFEYDGISAREGAIDLQKQLAPILQKMVADGAFDKIKTGLAQRGFSVLHLECNLGINAPFLHWILDEAAVRAKADSLNTLIATLEKTCISRERVKKTLPFTNTMKTRRFSSRAKKPKPPAGNGTTSGTTINAASWFTPPQWTAWSSMTTSRRNGDSPAKTPKTSTCRAFGVEAAAAWANMSSMPRE